jgi:transposase
MRIHTLYKDNKWSKRKIARELGCCPQTVADALEKTVPPSCERKRRPSILDPYIPKIDRILEQSPGLSAVRILEEISKGEDGYPGEVTLVRDYVRNRREYRGRVYQEVFYEPGEAMQVDWGSGPVVKIGETFRRVSIFVAVLCFSRYMFIKFCLSQTSANFFRALVEALNAFGGSPRKIVHDNLKTAVLSGHGRDAVHSRPFLELCEHFNMQPIACQRRDPESKGIVEANVKYIRRNALAGRGHELTTWEAYPKLAAYWPEKVANARVHGTTRKVPNQEVLKERAVLNKLPSIPFDTDERTSVVARTTARILFETNYYSVPPSVVKKILLLRADDEYVRLFFEGQEKACHKRCFERRQRIVLEEHKLEALQRRHRAKATHVETRFNALGPEAVAFHLNLRKQPVKHKVHLRRLLNLVNVYGRTEVLQALDKALQLETYDAGYVHNIIHQQRRLRYAAPVTPLQPRRRELVEDIDLPEPNPALYDELFDSL